MRLIDADAVGEQIKEILLPISLTLNDIVQRKIEEAPTVDAVEVVRCKNCKWSTKNTMSKVVPLFCELEENAVFCDDYCSYGERKENNETD